MSTAAIIARLRVAETERRVAEKFRLMDELRQKDEASATAAREIYRKVDSSIDKSDLPLFDSDTMAIIAVADDDLLRLYCAERRTNVKDDPAWLVIYGLLKDTVREMADQMGVPADVRVFLALDPAGQIVLVRCVCSACHKDGDGECECASAQYA